MKVGSIIDTDTRVLNPNNKITGKVLLIKQLFKIWHCTSKIKDSRCLLLTKEFKQGMSQQNTYFMFMSLKLMLPARWALDDTLTIRALRLVSHPACLSCGSNKCVRRQCPKQFTPRCDSKPSSVREKGTNMMPAGMGMNCLSTQK